MMMSSTLTLKKRGFTLIESVIVIVVMGLAMITIVNFLAPQISRSGDPHYQTRSAALGKSVMSLILARGFDDNSDFSGSQLRCGEGAAAGTSQENCTLEADFGAEIGEVIARYDDVDDYIGCWEPAGTNGCNDLNTLIGENGATTYRNFRLDIDVTYQTVDLLKRINLTISASNQAPIVLDAYRGNY